MIDIQNIRFGYAKNKKIFDNFSLHIEKGMLYGLLGANGAGKTSLISLISGIHRPTSGSIIINDLNYKKHKKQILTQLAVVPQEYAFYPRLTILENLSFFSSLYQTDKQSIAEVIELTGLEHYQNQRANTLSGGLKRRLNLAIGLLNRPKLLILDEPTVGIDPQSRMMILETIKHLNQQGMTIIYTSHYMEEIEKICSHVGILNNGKLLKQSSTKNLLSNNSLSIYFEDNIVKHNWKKASQIFFKENQIDINEKNLLCDDIAQSAVTTLLDIIKNENLTVKQLKYGKKSLNEIYFHLIEVNGEENIDA